MIIENRLTSKKRGSRCVRRRHRWLLTAVFLVTGGLIIPVALGTAATTDGKKIAKPESKAQLSEAKIESGAKLIRKLDERGILPEAAFWLYFSDIQKWKLVVAQIKLGPIEPKEIYKKIQETMTLLGEEIKEISLDDVALAQPQTPIVALLRAAIRTGPGISGIRFTGNVINGTRVEDAYIYRLK